MRPYSQLFQIAFPQLHDDIALALPLFIAFGSQQRTVYQYFGRILIRRIGTEGQRTTLTLFPQGVIALYDAGRHDLVMVSSKVISV